MSTGDNDSEDQRDDFSVPTKDLLAKRSGYICAYPGCRRMTVAVSEDRKSGLTLTGVAAHITAAKRGGPRHDESMSHDERSSESNGIWTCQIHGKFVDDNPSKCTVEQLRRWKAQHEQWVFDRVQSGSEMLKRGVGRLAFRNIGVFRGEYHVRLGRHNILVGLNEAGKTSLCEILASFSGGDHWRRFNHRFDFSTQAVASSFVEAAHWNDDGKIVVRMSPQVASMVSKSAKKSRQRVHLELNGCPATDWPRSLFRVLFFDEQLYRRHHSDPHDPFIKAIRYLATVLGTDESLIWDALCEELFASSPFGFRFKRTGARKVDILVPDGRDFYLPHGNLSLSERQMAFLDVTLSLTSRRPSREGIIYIFDTTFFQRLDEKNKKKVFHKFTNLDSSHYQTLFCLTEEEDAEVLKGLQSDNWVNAERVGLLTIHTFN